MPKIPPELKELIDMAYAAEREHVIGTPNPFRVAYSKYVKSAGDRAKNPESLFKEFEQRQIPVNVPKSMMDALRSEYTKAMEALILANVVPTPPPTPTPTPTPTLEQKLIDDQKRKGNL